MALQESGEMYLETIHRLSMEQQYVRSIDVAESMGFSKPSVSRAVALLKQGGYLLVNEHGHLSLTDEGKQVAEKVFERHTVLTTMLTALGVDAETASEDACRMEHVISEQTFEAIKRHIRQYGA
ncbi:MAG: metal-dependent transcriptional regulator [Clostridia bacterium]|nr:metal-dependent transcriptional regulator [Clostridia bacterium]